MKYKLVKLADLSGKAATIYSVAMNDEPETFFEQFVDANVDLFKSEISDIAQRLSTIGRKTGARMEYFKDKEGRPGDGVCALYDRPNSHLRLYCIRYGTQLVVLGGGGHKPKNIRAFQDDPILKKENYFLRELSRRISERIVDKDIRFVDDGHDFEGDLEFDF